LTARDAPQPYLNCPRCHLSLRPRVGWLTVEHCPRCLARERVAVPLFASRLPARELYADAPRPADAPGPSG
jgi:hypothetical protein